MRERVGRREGERACVVEDEVFGALRVVGEIGLDVFFRIKPSRTAVLQTQTH